MYTHVSSSNNISASDQLATIASLTESDASSRILMTAEYTLVAENSGTCQTDTDGCHRHPHSHSNTASKMSAPELSETSSLGGQSTSTQREIITTFFTVFSRFIYGLIHLTLYTHVHYNW